MSRSVNERIAWFRTHRPPAPGMCLRHTWEATALPAVGMPDANAGTAYVKKHGELRTDRRPPRGAWVWWTSPTHGHVCLSLGDGRILSTDVNGPATTGDAPLSHPELRWGHTYAGWSDWYGETFDVALTPRQRRRRLRRILDALTDRIRRLRHRRARVSARLDRKAK